MPSYQVSAVSGGQAVDLCTCDTAALALLKYRDALGSHRRVGVTDASGNDISEEELAHWAKDETRRAAPT